MRKCIIVLLFLNLLNLANAQEIVKTYSKLHFNSSYGINIPLTNVLTGEVTDNLFDYSDNSYYWQICSASYFFSPKLGIEASIQLGFTQNTSGRADRFNAQIEKEYSEDYFVTVGSGAEYESTSLFGESVERLYFGLVYRIDKPKYVVMPKISIGVTSFYTDWGSASLKEKGTNIVYELSYDSGKRANNHFTFAPSLTFGYKLSKRMILNMDIIYSFYKTDIEYKKELRNTFTNKITTETFDYKKNINTLTIGVGLIISLRHRPKPSQNPHN